MGQPGRTRNTIARAAGRVSASPAFAGRQALAVAHRGGQGDIYIWELARPWSSAARITVAPGIDWFPVWTADARRIAFGSWRGGRFSNLYMFDLGVGSTERLTESPEMQLPTSITPDGTTLIYHSFNKSLQAVRFDSRSEPVTVVETPGEERNGELSPDGRWLAYEGESPSTSGQLDIYVRRFPDVNRGLWQVSRNGGTFPLWSRDGRELYYITLEGTMVAVPVQKSSGVSGLPGIRKSCSGATSTSARAVSDASTISLQTADS